MDGRGHGHERQRARRVAMLAAALLAATCPGVVVPAVAAPTPSQAQVDAARAAVGDKAAQVVAVQAQLAAADDALDVAQRTAAVAAEAFDAAQQQLAERAAAARAAGDVADQAQAKADDARAAVGRLAAGSYRSGGGFDGFDRVSAFLDADGPQDLLDQVALLDSVATRTDRAYQQLRSADAVAALLRAQAQAALDQQQEAAVVAAAARDTAQRAADAATALLDSTQQQQAALVDQLAQLQGISTALAAQRQAGLAAERAAAADAAARSDRARRQAPSSPGSSSGSSSSSATTPPGSSSAGSTQAAAVLLWARTQIGEPYLWGASGPDAWDCSGLTSQAYRAAGVGIPRTSAQQYRSALKVSFADLRPGDLIFYGTDPDDWSTVHHVAIYAGGGDMVEAPRAGLDVRETPVRYAGSMAWAGRV